MATVYTEEEQESIRKGDTPLLQRRSYGTTAPDQTRTSVSHKKPPKIDVVWKNLNYSVREKKDGPLKKVLNNVSGEVRSGQLCAFMGSSGAGKTTLLNVLSCRADQPENITGVMELNNVSYDRRLLRKVSSYVVQEEHLADSLTVRETFVFYSTLKLPKSMSQVEKEQIADEVIDELGLTKARETLIGGNFFRGVSGGEKRRVSIGIELVTRPGLIFLDEPTTGLDSNSSYNVISILKKLTREGRTIIASIHQPRPDIFYQMDTLFLLFEGNTFYFGPVSRCTEYFTSIGFKCPVKMNPADYILDVTTPGADIIGYSGTLKNDDIRGLCQKYVESDIGREMASKVNTPSQFAPLDVAKQSEELDRLSAFEQMKLLMWRNIVTLKRNSIEFEARVISTLFMGLIGGLVFFDLSESTSGVRSRISAVFYTVAAIVFSSIFQLVQVFPLERDLVIHERRGNAYSLNSYYLSRMLTDRLPLLILPLIFSFIFYYMANLRDGGEHFFKFLLMVFVLFNSAQSLSLFIGSIVPDPSVGAIAAPLFGVIFMLFSSYLVKRSEIPKSVKWITDISLIRWGMQALAQNEFDDVEYEDADPRGCGYQTGDDVLDDYDYDDYDYGESVFYSLVIFMVFNVLLYISLFARDRATVKNI